MTIWKLSALLLCLAIHFGILLQLVSAKPSTNHRMAQSKVSWKQHQIIDIHAHIGDFAGFDLSDATLLENLQERGILKAFISNIDCAALPGVTQNLDEKTANDRTVQTVRAHPELLRGLLWVRPEEKNTALAATFLNMTISERNNKKLFVGMKFHPDMNKFPADNATVDPFLKLCQQFHIPAVFHCGGSRQLSSPQLIYNAAKRHPKVPVVLYHMGFNTDHRDAIECARQALTKGDANLYVETSQCDADAVLRALKTLGSSRVLFGTDATYFGKEHYAHYEDMVEVLKKQLSNEDFKKVVHQNAVKLFPL